MKQIFKYILCACLVAAGMIVGEGVMWGDSTYYAKVSTAVSGSGTAYVSAGNGGVSGANTSVISSEETSSSSANITFSIQANPATHYHFNGWTTTGGSLANSSNASTTLTVTSSNESSPGVQVIATANFQENFYGHLSVSNSSTGASGAATGGGNFEVTTAGGTQKYSLVAQAASSGFHFKGWTGTGITFSSAPSLTTDATVAASTTPGGTASYTATAEYEQDFYANVSTASDPVSVSITGGGSQSTATSGGSLSYTLTAPAESGKYHFKNWTSNGANTIPGLPSTSNPVNITVSASTSPGNSLSYTARANYEIDNCKASLTVNSGGNGTASVATSPLSTDTKGANVIFSISATPSAGYHFDHWEKTGSVGTFGSTTSASTTFTAPAASTHNGTASYTVTAVFAVDQYNAQLSVQQSSSSVYGTSTIAVSSDGTNWSNSVTKSASTGGANINFTVKATPAAGYIFLGWSETNGSSTYVSTNATYSYTVKSSSTLGATNSKTLYAVFRKQYSIVLTTTGVTSLTDRLVFVVTGGSPSATYRVSVPVGGSVTLKDVNPGSYTVTPETGWSWAYTVSPSSSNSSFNSANTSTHTFTLGASSKASKIHTEATQIIH